MFRQLDAAAKLETNYRLGHLDNLKANNFKLTMFDARGHMVDQIHNETLKLVANWLNSASVAVVAGGVVVPFSAYVYGTAANMPQPDWLLFVFCILGGIALHLLGIVLIGALDHE